MVWGRMRYDCRFHLIGRFSQMDTTETSRARPANASEKVGPAAVAKNVSLFPNVSWRGEGPLKHEASPVVLTFDVRTAKGRSYEMPIK